MLTQHMELIFDIWSKQLEKDILFERPKSSDLDVCPHRITNNGCGLETKDVRNIDK